MKLHAKFIVYNLILKACIIGLLTVGLVSLVDKVSENNLKDRVREKQEKLLKNLSHSEITSLLDTANSFTDYNILKEEYIILSEISPFKKANVEEEHFTVQNREIEGRVAEYLILANRFTFEGAYYKLEIGVTTSVQKQIERTIMVLGLLVLVISSCLSFLADYIFVERMMSPFYRIIDKKMKKVHDPEHFDFTSIVSSTDDFNYLDESINGMMRKINAQFSMQKQFTSNVSHELLTPVSVIKSRLENLLIEESIPHHMEEKIVASLRTVNRLKSIVNSLLLISKIENSQYLKTDRIVVKKIIQEVCEDLEDRLEIKNIKLSITLTEDFVYTANNALIHTLFMNIVNNAIKYNKEQGAIFISDECDNGSYAVVVRDEGRGMTPEMIAKAFNRFEKLGSTENDSYGLGLAIVTAIATFHEIKIEIDSKLGAGTSFRIRFPRSLQGAK